MKLLITSGTQCNVFHNYREKHEFSAVDKSQSAELITVQFKRVKRLQNSTTGTAGRILHQRTVEQADGTGRAAHKHERHERIAPLLPWYLAVAILVDGIKLNL